MVGQEWPRLATAGFVAVLDGLAKALLTLGL